MSAGQPNQLKWLKSQFESRYIVKFPALGPGKGNQQRIMIPNRLLTWHDARGIGYEAGPRHIEIILKHFQFNGAKAATTPGTKEEGRTREDHSVLLGDKEATNYRAIVARCNYLALGRPDIAFVVGKLARAMSKPTRADLQGLKRFARYFKGMPRLVLQCDCQPMRSAVTNYSDADWTGCREIRRSTTGGCVTIGAHSIKGRSETHSLVALSSGESESHASLTTVAETVGILSMLKDL